MQNRRHRQTNRLIPTCTLNASSDGFYANFYDSEKDYVFLTEAFCWNAASIVILWAILNQLFCSHEEIANIVECGIKKCTWAKMWITIQVVKELFCHKSLGAFRNDPRQSKRMRVRRAQNTSYHSRKTIKENFHNIPGHRLICNKSAENERHLKGIWYSTFFAMTLFERFNWKNLEQWIYTATAGACSWPQYKVANNQTFGIKN